MIGAGAVSKRSFAAAAALACAACVPMAGPPETPRPAGDIVIEGSRVFPESVTSDAAGNLYNASTAGTVYRTLAGTTRALPWIVPSGQNGLKSLFGVYADDARGLLWVCNNPNLFARETGQSSLRAFDLASGELSAAYAFPEDGPAACNDIAVASDGTVWASETSGGRIFVLRPNANELALFARSEDLVGIDGIALAGDGTIYINNVRQNLFQRVERKADESFAALTTLATSSPLNGPDGLRAMGGNRFIQAEGPGGRVALVDVAGDSATLTDVATGLDGSVGVTVSGRTAYVVEGKIQYLFDPALKDRDPDPFVIRAFPLPEGK
jgi:outer membrane protein assembly factor BamB